VSAERIAVVARLRPGALDRVHELVARGAPFDLEATGLDRHSIFACEGCIVFVFDGPRVEQIVRRLLDDPVVSAEFSSWAPALASTPTFAQEEFSWVRGPAARDAAKKTRSEQR
jgi:hypothetical protein